MQSRKRRGRPPSEPKTELGRWLRVARAKADLTQAQVAEGVGVTCGHIAKLESGGVKDPTTATLMALAKFFGVKTQRLLRMVEVRRDSDAPGAA